MSLAFFTRTRTGEVQSRIANDIGGMQAMVTTTATSIVSNLTTVIATIIAMLVLDWRLTMVSLLLLPVFVVDQPQGRPASARRSPRERQRQLAAISSMVQESLSVSGILLGRTMGRSPELTERFADASDELADLEVRSSMAGRWRQSTDPDHHGRDARGDLLGQAGLTTGRSPSAPLVAFTTLQTNLFRPAVSLLRARRRRAELAGAVRPDLRVPRPARRHPSRAPATLSDVRGEVRFEHVDFSYAATAPTHARTARPDRPRRAPAWPWSARPARARPRSATCSPGCTT